MSDSVKKFEEMNDREGMIIMDEDDNDLVITIIYFLALVMQPKLEIKYIFKLKIVETILMIQY